MVKYKINHYDLIYKDYILILIIIIYTVMHLGIISFCGRIAYNIKSNDVKSDIL